MRVKAMIVILLAMSVGEASPQYLFDIRSLSMGKTSVANSLNTSAMGFNPANILSQRSGENATVYLNLLTNAGAYLSSDFISIDFYDKYFKKQNGKKKELTLGDKNEILSKASDGYTEFYVSANLFSAVVNTRIGSFGIALTEKAGTSIRLSKDFVDLALKGYSDGKSYNFSDLKLGGAWIRQANLTYANKVKPHEFVDEISFGISVKPQFGMYYFGTEQNNLNITVDDINNIRSTGEVKFYSAGNEKFNNLMSYLKPSGFGFGFDAGVNMKIRKLLGFENINFGLSLTDIGSINWTRNTYQYYYNGNFNITDITNQGQIDSLRDAIKNSKAPGSSFSTTLPATLRVGMQFKLFSGTDRDSVSKSDNPELANFSIDFIQGLNNSFNGTTKTIVAIGAELNLLNFIYPRAGIILGGNEKTGASFGVGLNLGMLDLDIGTANVKGLFNPKNASNLSGGVSLKMKF